MANSDPKFTRTNIEEILAAGLGTTVNDLRVTGSSYRVGAFEEFLMYLVPDSEDKEYEVHTLLSYTGTYFTELDADMAVAWVTGRTLV